MICYAFHSSVYVETLIEIFFLIQLVIFNEEATTPVRYFKRDGFADDPLFISWTNYSIFRDH